MHTPSTDSSNGSEKKNIRLEAAEAETAEAKADTAVSEANTARAEERTEQATAEEAEATAEEAEATAKSAAAKANKDVAIGVIMTLAAEAAEAYKPVASAHAALLTVKLEEKAKTVRMIESAKRCVLESLEDDGAGSPSDKLDIIERIISGGK